MRKYNTKNQKTIFQHIKMEGNRNYANINWFYIANNTQFKLPEQPGKTS